MNISDVGFFKEKWRPQTFFEVPLDCYCTSVNTIWHTASLIQDHAELAPTFFYLIPILRRFRIIRCNRQAALHSAMFNYTPLVIRGTDKNKQLTIIKGTQAWDIFVFFFTQIKSLYALGEFSKKNSLSFLRFSPEFRSSKHTRNQIFFERYPKIFFFKIFTMVLLDGLLDGFSNFGFFIIEICILIRDFWVIFENYCMRMLSIRGNDFIACWAY
jgi:hypothetical protein